ncbi:MAG: YdcF family protein [Lachnospiraceae bacterium]|nr:YdcF family protein [Lachnospiraceae bacterium]
MEIFKAVSDFIFVSDELTKADVIIIPGSSRIELAERASKLLKEGYAKFVIVSGADNRKLSVSEAEFLYDEMIKTGCDPDQIIKENRAKNTYENAVFSLSKCRENNIKTDRIIIVCKNYHSRRVKLTFQSVFCNSQIMICPVCDSTGITSENWYRSKEKSKIVFKEVEKIGKYMPDIIQPAEEQNRMS